MVRRLLYNFMWFRPVRASNRDVYSFRIWVSIPLGCLSPWGGHPDWG